jgi:hypothetical protein
VVAAGGGGGGGGGGPTAPLAATGHGYAQAVSGLDLPELEGTALAMGPALYGDPRILPALGAAHLLAHALEHVGHSAGVYPGQLGQDLQELLGRSLLATDARIGECAGHPEAGPVIQRALSVPMGRACVGIADGLLSC